MIVDIHAHIGHHPLMDFKQKPVEVLEVMDKYGIDKTFIHPFPSMRTSIVNEMVSKAVDSNPDKLVGFACIDPSNDDSLKELKRSVELGLKGVMMDPEFHGVFRNISKVEELMVLCMEYKLPVLFNTPNIETVDHASYIIGGISEPYYRGVDQLAFKFPEVKLIVSTFWPRIRELVRMHSNIFIDTGSRNGVSGAVRLTQDIGPTRICFGSESPQNHPALGIKVIQKRKMAPIYKKLLLGDNAIRIFKDIL
jgi:predicted TIM-barrel fold metal-dependent hydrolase